jgi:hypothetical protein
VKTHIIAAFFAAAITSTGLTATLANFDDITSGPIGDQYLSIGLRFYVGNGSEGSSTGLLLSGGSPVSAAAGNFGTSISPPNVMVPLAGTNNDLFVYFYDSAQNRVTASSVGIFNDMQGDPSRIFIEGFDTSGASLGRTQIDGAGVGGIFSAQGIYTAKIYGAPGFGGLIGVDNFSADIVPEPSSIILLAGGGAFYLGRRFRNKRA